MDVALEELTQLNQPLPRYTSYPTAPQWGRVEPQAYQDRLEHIDGAIALYIHIPFCKTMVSIAPVLWCSIDVLRMNRDM